MKVEFKNVGCIKDGVIDFKSKKLNIKYGVNGLGKSTMSKAIYNKSYDYSMAGLVPHGTNLEPVVKITGTNISNPLIFNQEYVDTRLFKEDIIGNTFEIVINTVEYNESVKRINELFHDLNIAIKNTKLNEIKYKLDDFLDSIKFTKNTDTTIGKIHGNCKFSRGKKMPDLSKKLQEDSKKYIIYLEGDKNDEWFKWFNKGMNYLKENNLEKCPFCDNPLIEEIDKLENAHKDINSVVNGTHLAANMKMKKMIGNMKGIITDNQETILKKELKIDTFASQEELKILHDLRRVIEIEKTKIDNLNSLSINKIKQLFEDNKLIEYIKENKLNYTFFKELDKEFKVVIKNINQKIDDVYKSADYIQSLTKEFADKLNDNIKKNKDYVNDFLEIAGIPYYIDIIPSDDENYRTVLCPKAGGRAVNDKPLSYGEKNAISLVLFSLEANKSNFIILDDPVSSFDNNKKFAIFHYMFKNDKGKFKNKTVILFTHDFEVIVDFVFKNELKNVSHSLYILKNSNGTLKEKNIKDDDIKATVLYWKDCSENKEKNELIRIINLRKYYDYLGEGDNIEYEILSSLEHLRDIPMIKKGETFEEIKGEIYINAVNNIREYIKDFDYDKYLSIIKDHEKLRAWYFAADASDVEKIQILRAFLTNKKHNIGNNKVFCDFITETYHVENNSIVKITDGEYDTIPYYIMKICDEIMKEPICDEI